MNDEFGIDVSDSDSDEEEEDLIFTDESEAPVRVGLVPCAIAGSKIRDWLSGDRNGQNPMRDTLVNVQDAMKAGGVLKGILWHQGEDDCTPENAPRYGKDLEAMVDQIRKAVGDPDLPFLVGQMSPEGMNSREKQMVNDVHKNLPNRVPNCAFVNATGLESADPRDVDHFSPDSYRELGERYADAYAHLLNHGPIRGVLSDRVARDNRLKPERGAQRGTLLDDMPEQLRPHRLLGDSHAASHMELPLPGSSQRRNSDDRIRPELSGFGNSGPLRLNEGPDSLRGDRTRRGSMLQFGDDPRKMLASRADRLNREQPSQFAPSRSRYVEDAPSLMPSKGLVRNAAPSYMVLPGSKEPEEEGPVHFFILAGGSNMVGFGPVSKSDQEPDPRVVALSGQGEWVPAKEPLFAKYGLGPGKAFGERLANHYLKNKKYSSKRTPEERRRHKEKKLRLKRLVEEKQKEIGCELTRWFATNLHRNVQILMLSCRRVSLS